MDPRKKKPVQFKIIQNPSNKKNESYLSSSSAKHVDQKDDQKFSTADMVVQLLNQASTAIKDVDKVENLHKVQELVINKQSDLLDSFSDEVVAFQADRSSDVRKFVIGFMEEACKKDQELFSKFLPNFYMLLVDQNVGIMKKVVQSSTQLYRLCIQWIALSGRENDVLQVSWKTMLNIQTNIIKFLESENDGVRTQSVKFIEKVVITLSEKHRFSEVPKKVEPFSSLDQLPNNHAILKKSELKSIGEDSLQHLLKFVGSPAISSVNLMAAMGTLTTIAKQRPHYLSTVVQTFETLHVNLPPTLAKTQVTSVRKHLKMQLLNLLRHQASIEYHPQITNLLYDLGTNSTEISRNMPKVTLIYKEKARKRSPGDDEGETDFNNSVNKKAKVDLKDEYDDEEENIGKISSTGLCSKTHSSAIDITADELVPLLTPENVANLVLLSMVMLPDKIPDAFQASYTPIESAGTMEQIMHLARLLSTQMTAVGIGSGIQFTAEMQAEEAAKKKLEREKEEKEKERNKPSVPIQTLIGGTTANDDNRETDTSKRQKIVALEPVQTVIPSRSLQRRIQGFHLATVTKPLSLDVKDRIIKMAVLRILKAERSAIAGGVHHKWQKILTSLVAQFGGDLHRSLAKFILMDVRNRSKLAFQWLYEEFNIYLENSRGLNDRSAQENYDACLTSLLQGLLEKHDSKEGLFNKLVLQAPLLTDSVVSIVQSYCEDERKVHSGLSLIRELVSCRPTKRMQFLRVLLDLTTFKTEKVRTQAILITKRFYDNKELYELIEQYAVTNLTYLKQNEPPNDLIKFGNDDEKKWTEDIMKQCMSLFLFLLPVNHNLIHKLAEVYVETTADIKRVILRALETPVHGMGMSSVQLLRLVETCPKGAETLVTRMLHILTDREHPSIDLVCRVRDLYQKRVPDVRFLIPVLNGLEKHEVLLALPKLVRLNPPVVKGVFKRLLGVQRPQDSKPSVSALSPVELLVALHNIDPSKADVMCIIKATSLCFSEKAVYTSEVLVTVINQLVEQDVIPTLLMRTVIQALITYPRLFGFVTNILQRLIMKRVWEQTKIWEGFIRCCQRMKPQSFQVLLQLPPAQLSSVFETLPDLREPLLQHVNKFTPQQRQHISSAILSVLESTPEQRHAEMQALAAQRVLEEMRTREKEEQVRVAQEWEQQERVKQKQQAAESARQEKERIDVERAQESERRLQEQKERAMALVLFQQRAVKNEPKAENGDYEAFPLTAESSSSNVDPGSLPVGLPNSEESLNPIPLSSQAYVPPPNSIDTKPVITSTGTAAINTDSLAEAAAESISCAVSSTNGNPLITALTAVSSLPPHLMPPGLVPKPMQMNVPPPHLLTPSVSLPLPAHLLERLPLIDPKREQRSPTPTQDEQPDKV